MGKEYILMVYAVVIRGDEILATLHDRGLGAFWGLPGEYAAAGNPIQTVAEMAVLEQTSLTVSAGRLLGIQHILDYYEPVDTLFMSLACDLKSENKPKLPENSEPSDGSINGCAWVKLDKFMYDFSLPEIERKFWNQSIKVYRNEAIPDLNEIDITKKF